MVSPTLSPPGTEQEPEILSRGTLTIETSLSARDFEFLTEQAGFGIGYWASSAVEEPNKYTVTSEEGEFVITPDKIREILEGILQGKYGRTCQALWEVALDTLQGRFADPDPADADLIIQLACFGEIVYG